MSTPDDVQMKEEIEDRFDELYRFLRDVIVDPAPLDRIPDNSTLEFRTLRVNGQRVQLTAHRRSNSDDPWTARVTSWDSQGGLEQDRVASHQAAHVVSPLPLERRIEDESQLVYRAETADAALDALEQVIRQRPALIASGGQT